MMDLTKQLAILGKKYEVVLDKPFVSVYHFNDTKTGFIYWKSKVSFEEYKEGFEAMLKKHKQSPCDYLITDIVNQGVSSNEKKEWFKNIAMKQALEIGLKKAAVILDNNPFREFYVNLILGFSKSLGLPFKTFRSISQAKAWIDG